MRYIVFTRVSGNLQDTANQLFECNEYLNAILKKGDKVVYVDEDVKSTKFLIKDRPVITEMLECLCKGDTVIVYKLNRLARGHELALLHYTITKEKKALLYSLYEGDMTDQDQLIHAHAMVAAFERKNIQTNTSTALRRKAASLEMVGSEWYGYKLDHTVIQTREKARSSGKPYKLIPHEEEQETIKTMLELRDQGYTYQDIALNLESQGVRNRNGNPIGISTVFKVLRRIKEGVQPLPV